MVEKEFLQTSPKEISSVDVEYNAHFGKIHLDEVAAEMRGDVVWSTVQTMQKAGISYQQVADILGLERDDDKRVEGMDPWNRMRLGVVMFGEDPTPTLKQVQLDRDLTRKTAYDVILEHIQVGSIYNLLGNVEDSMKVLGRAEAIIDGARDEFTRAFHHAKVNGADYHDAMRAGLDGSLLIGHDTSYHNLADAYADEGMYDDALRVLDKLKEDKSFYLIPSAERISELQSRAGLVDEAVVTAERLGGPLVAKALARKAVFEAEHGGNYQDTVESVERRLNNITLNLDYVDFRFRQRHLATLGGNPMAAMMHGTAGKPFNTGDTVEILTLLGEAAGKAQNFAAAEQYFRTAHNHTNGYDYLTKPRLLLFIAKGVGAAGFDSREFYKEIFRSLQEMGEPDPENDLSLVDAINPWLRWGPWEGAIRGLVDEGHFDIARQWLPGFTPQISYEFYERNRINLLAYVGSKEIVT